MRILHLNLEHSGNHGPLEIEIPDPPSREWLEKNGAEIVGYRRPLKGETFYDHFGAFPKLSPDDNDICYRWILRKVEPIKKARCSDCKYFGAGDCFDVVGECDSVSKWQSKEPKLERCEVKINRNGWLTFIKKNDFERTIDEAVSFPDFAGFDYGDGNVFSVPIIWKDKGGNLYADPMSAPDTGNAFRPVAVLFKEIQK